MGGSLNVSDGGYGIMLKTKRILSVGSKRSMTCQKILPFLMRQRKDKVKKMKTQFSDSHSPTPPRIRPFLYNGFFDEQTLSVNNNVSAIKRLDYVSHIPQKFRFLEVPKKKKKIIKNVKES